MLKGQLQNFEFKLVITKYCVSSLLTYAMQPNFIQTHITLFWILVEIQKFQKVPNMPGQSVVKCENDAQVSLSVNTVASIKSWNESIWDSQTVWNKIILTLFSKQT